VNQLSWVTPPSGIITYGISRNATAYATTSLQNYSDTGIVCQTNYCYQISSTYTNGSVSKSLIKCLKAFTTKVPTMIENSSAVVSSAGVELTWLQDPSFTPTQYFILRQQNGGSFLSIASATTQLYDDTGYSTQGNFCYLIDYTDKCGNNSAQGAPICPLRLLGTLDKSNTITLVWNPYQGWENGVKNYTLEKFDQQGNLIKTTALGTVITFTDDQPDPLNQVVSYQVTATANDAGLTASVSNVAKFIKDTNLYSPTAFTPNGDGNNDTFSVTGFFISKLELNIFNRWGNLIFSTDTNQAWDGTFSGKLMPNDTYVWTAKGSDLTGHSFAQSGTVILLTPPK
jgi:gliding motility-associated-like protein